MENEISTKELQSLIKMGEGYVLIDVREKSELAYGTIPSAKNVPCSELESAEKLSQKDFKKKYGFPKFKHEDNIIIYCRSGRRAAKATEFLNKRSYHARNYKGSILEWSKIDKRVRAY
jgi:rhodanese-related sulfurtransferase